jgi:hypothetical protein
VAKRNKMPYTMDMSNFFFCPEDQFLTVPSCGQCFYTALVLYRQYSQGSWCKEAGDIRVCLYGIFFFFRTYIIQQTVSLYHII